MKLQSFRQLLLKKAEGFLELQDLIKNVDDLFLIESIEKAVVDNRSGGIKSPALSAWLNDPSNPTSDVVTFIRHALAHHVSHHKAALKALRYAMASGNKQDEIQARKTADQHLEKIVPLMHLASQLKHLKGQYEHDSDHEGIKEQKFDLQRQLAAEKDPAKKADIQKQLQELPEDIHLTSNEPINFLHENTRPWETNYRGTARDALGKHPTEGLNARPSSGSNDTIPNYRYLEMAPHADHPEVKEGKVDSELLDKGYPFHTIQLGSQRRIDAGRGHLPLWDVGNVDLDDQGNPMRDERGVEKRTPLPFISHAFDEHPAFKVMQQGKWGRVAPDQFEQDLKGWKAQHEGRLWGDLEKDEDDLGADHLHSATQSEHHFEGIPALGKDSPHLHPKAKALFSTGQKTNPDMPVSAPVAAAPKAVAPSFSQDSEPQGEVREDLIHENNPPHLELLQSALALQDHQKQFHQLDQKKKDTIQAKAKLLNGGWKHLNKDGRTSIASIVYGKHLYKQ